MPAIVEGDFCLSESHVIMKYLCNKQGTSTLLLIIPTNFEKGETSLYPTEPVARAKIDEALARVSDIKFGCFLPKLFGKITEVPAEKVTEFEESLTAFLAPYKQNADSTGYLFGDSITIGNLSFPFQFFICTFLSFLFFPSFYLHFSADIAMFMRLTMARMAGYKWDKYPSMQKMSVPKGDASTAAFKKVNELVMKVVESGTGNFSVLGGL